MTDEQIMKAFEYCAKESQNTCTQCPYYTDEHYGCDDLKRDLLDYINRLKERIDTMHYENENLQTYIYNHEEIWKRNAEIDKAIVRKETAKEIIGLMKQVQAMFYDREYVAIQNIIAKRYGVEVD